jgi:hypothetical protein
MQLRLFLLVIRDAVRKVENEINGSLKNGAEGWQNGEGDVEPGSGLVSDSMEKICNLQASSSTFPDYTQRPAVTSSWNAPVGPDRVYHCRSSHRLLPPEDCAHRCVRVTPEYCESYHPPETDLSPQPFFSSLAGTFLFCVLHSSPTSSSGPVNLPGQRPHVMRPINNTPLPTERLQAISSKRRRNTEVRGVEECVKQNELPKSRRIRNARLKR